jgi:hypothetical protein
MASLVVTDDSETRNGVQTWLSVIMLVAVPPDDHEEGSPNASVDPRRKISVR